jgi:hypothetical protein
MTQITVSCIASGRFHVERLEEEQSKEKQQAKAIAHPSFYSIPNELHLPLQNRHFKIQNLKSKI